MAYKGFFNNGQEVDFRFEDIESDALYKYVADWAKANSVTKAQLRAAIVGVRNGGGVSATNAHNTGMDSLQRYCFVRHLIDAVKEAG